MTVKQALENYEAQKAIYDPALVELNKASKLAEKIITGHFHGAPLMECFHLAIRDLRFTGAQRAMLAELHPVWVQHRDTCCLVGPKVEKALAELASVYMGAVSDFNDSLEKQADSLTKEFVTVLCGYGYGKDKAEEIAKECPNVTAIRSKHYYSSFRDKKSLIAAARRFDL